MKKDLAVDQLREDGMSLLEKYSDILDQDHKETSNGLLESEKILDIHSETFGEDVAYFLNLIIEVLTSCEDRMSEEDKELFDDICVNSLKLHTLSKYHIGQLIIHNDLPHMVMNIDFDDLTMCLGDGVESEIWVETDDLN